MTWKQSACVALLVLVAAGCVRSLHGLYTQKDLVFKPELLGRWNEEGEQNSWTFTQSGENEYLLRFVQQGGIHRHGAEGTAPDSATFEVHMVNLEGQLFLDFYPQEPEVKTELCKVHMLPVHTFWTVRVEPGHVRLAMLSHDWLKKKVDAGELKIKHERVNEEIILTAPTAELQKMMVSIGDQEDAYAEPVDLMKVE
jgi:hypothetical protein